MYSLVPEIVLAWLSGAHLPSWHFGRLSQDEELQIRLGKTVSQGNKTKHQTNNGPVSGSFGITLVPLTYLRVRLHDRVYRNGKICP